MPLECAMDSQVWRNVYMHTPSFDLTHAVQYTLSDYFNTLDGAEPHDIHALIMNHVEKILIEHILRRTQGNQTQAAKLLGINRNTLYSKIQRYQLDGLDHSPLVSIP